MATGELDLKTLVKQGLLRNTFGGLYSDDFGCACRADDLMPCDEPQINCYAGYIRKNTIDCSMDAECDDPESCDFLVGEGSCNMWIISGEKL